MRSACPSKQITRRWSRRSTLAFYRRVVARTWLHGVDAAQTAMTAAARSAHNSGGIAHAAPGRMGREKRPISDPEYPNRVGQAPLHEAGNKTAPLCKGNLCNDWIRS